MPAKKKTTKKPAAKKKAVKKTVKKTAKKKVAAKKTVKKAAPKKKAAAKKPVRKTAAKKTAKKATPKKKAVAKKPAPKKTPAPVNTTGLKEGRKAPDFKIQDEQGKTRTLADFKGKKIVLYFYPKDNTPGCTAQACALRDGIDKIKKKKAVVIGVSPDSVKSHQNFKQKFDLNFSLLSDEGKVMVRKYGVWKQKSLYGKKYMGVERTTFVLNEQGKIAKIFPKVKVDQHFDDVLAVL